MLDGRLYITGSDQRVLSAAAWDGKTKYKVNETEEEETLPSQLSPVFRSDGEISNEEFELTFLATVPALGLQTYYIREMKSEDGPNDEMSVAKVKIYNTKSQPFQVNKQPVR